MSGNQTTFNCPLYFFLAICSHTLFWITLPAFSKIIPIHNSEVDCCRDKYPEISFHDLIFSLHNLYFSNIPASFDQTSHISSCTTSGHTIGIIGFILSRILLWPITQSSIYLRFCQRKRKRKRVRKREK